MAQEPTILVKKSDGTNVKMTLTEFKEYQKLKKSVESSGSAEPEKKIKVQEEKKSKEGAVIEPPANLPVVENESILVEEEREEKNLPAVETPHELMKKESVSLVKKEEPVKIAKKERNYKKQKGKKIEEIKKTTETVFEQKEKTKELTQDDTHWKGEDLKSPLEEDLGEEFQKSKQEESVQERQVDTIVQNLSFTVEDELKGRLRTLILSRLKEVRNDDLFRQYTKKKSLDGGVELTDAQVDEILRLVHGVKGEESGITTETSSSEEFLKLILPREESKSQSKKGKDIISKILQEDHARSGLQKVEIPEVKETAEKAAQKQQAPIITKISSIAAEKKGNFTYKEPMRDIKASKSEMAVGPVEEVGNLTFEDFKRLGRSPKEISKKLFEKFESIKDESYLLYLDAIDAWHRSPLYLQYLGILTTAVNTGQKIDDVLSVENQKIKREDFDAIREISYDLKP